MKTNRVRASRVLSAKDGVLSLLRLFLEIDSLRSETMSNAVSCFASRGDHNRLT